MCKVINDYDIALNYIAKGYEFIQCPYDYYPIDDR